MFVERIYTKFERYCIEGIVSNEDLLMARKQCRYLFFLILWNLSFTTIGALQPHFALAQFPSFQFKYVFVSAAIFITLVIITKKTKRPKITGWVVFTVAAVMGGWNTYKIGTVESYNLRGPVLLQAATLMIGKTGGVLMAIIHFICGNLSWALDIANRNDPTNTCSMERAASISAANAFHLGMVFLIYVTESHHEAIARELTEANDVKENFLCKMSHELRTPLFGIVGAIDLYKKQIPQNLLNQTQQNLLDIVNSCAEKLQQLISDILDFSKLSGESFLLANEVVVLRQAIKGAISVVSSIAIAKGVKLNLNISNEVPESMITDHLRIQQIFINLVGNSVKFTPQGGNVDVTVDVTQYDELSSNIKSKVTQHSSSFLSIKVSDTGIGMTQDTIRKLFNKFEQGDPNISKQFGGSGLGLAICNQIITKMGGHIEGKSAGKGSGSCFDVILPMVTLKQLDSASKSKLMNQQNSNISRSMKSPRKVKENILLAEDNTLNQFILKQMFDQLGYNATIVSNGQEAVDLVNEKSHEYYKAIFLDLEMPVLDGLSALKLIRLKNKIIPVIALSAHALAKEKEKVIAEGGNLYIPKPVTLATLEQTLNSLQQKPEQNID